MSAVIAGYGGAGRNISAMASWPNGTTHLRVIVGATGNRTMTAVSAGGGGEGSSVVAVDANGNVLAPIVVAGGGGGGGAGSTLK